MMEHKTIRETVHLAMDIMNSVSDKTNISKVPGVAKANRLMRSVGFGLMNLHGFLAKNYIPYGSKESIEFVDVFGNLVNFYSLEHSMLKAKKTGERFYKFETSKYADGSYFEDRGEILPVNDKVKTLFEGIDIPTNEDWENLAKDIMEYGLYNSHRLAIAPTGSISYVMSATPSIAPIKALVEERTYGNSKTYYPMPGSDKYQFMYENAFELDKFKTIDVFATLQKHIDQGISFELNILSDITSRQLQRYYLYAQHKGIKTLYYTRTKQLEFDECESCAV